MVLSYTWIKGKKLSNFQSLSVRDIPVFNGDAYPQRPLPSAQNNNSEPVLAEVKKQNAILLNSLSVMQSGFKQTIDAHSKNADNIATVARIFPAKFP